ncbi:MAG TPA: 30S ribosomal protein S3 [Nitrososphaerales archaeon]|nr:30S ribosomal protein S3 [Nitrososphaerales archaeon]
MPNESHSAIKTVMKNFYRNMELDEFLSKQLADAGYGGVDVQKTPVGTRITLYVTRPGLVIGRKGMGIKDLTDRLEKQFGLSSPQISVLEVEIPELNPRIIANRVSQLITRGTAFRRAALWALNTVMNAGALGAEIVISGKLRSERSHFEKYTIGIVPKSGETSTRIVKEAVAHLLLKMGLYGIRIKIAYKNAVPPDFEIVDNAPQEEEIKADG